MNAERFSTGGCDYAIVYRNGTHHIIEYWWIDELDDVQEELVFTGHYDKCLEHKQAMLVRNADYDLNL